MTSRRVPLAEFRKCRSLLVLAIAVNAVTSSAASMDVEIISILHANSTVGGLLWTGAALDLAVESVNEKFAGSLNLSVSFHSEPSDRSCDDAEASTTPLLAQYYNTKMFGQCVAVMACESKYFFDMSVRRIFSSGANFCFLLTYSGLWRPFKSTVSCQRSVPVIF